MLLDLPYELLERIFLLVNATDIPNISLVNWTIHGIITRSISIQVLVEHHLAGTQDNVQHPLTPKERLDLLQRRQEAWFTMTPEFSTKIPCNFFSGNLYDLTDNTYVLGDLSRRKLHWIRLPDSPGHIPSWNTFDPEDQVGPMVDFGLAISEHDLIALVTTSPTKGQAGYEDLELSLWQFSKSIPHPAAKQPRILLDKVQANPGIAIEIVGDHLIVTTTYSLRFFGPNVVQKDRLFIYDWRTGDLKMTSVADEPTYTGIIFLSEHIFMLPNIVSGSLELWDTSGAKKSIFRLPKLARDWRIINISCRCDPNPVGHQSQVSSSLPFQRAPSQSIIILEVLVENSEGARRRFTMFIHRSSLLALSLKEFFPTKHGKEGIPYMLWGPPITHILAINRPSRWITVTSGQLFVAPEMLEQVGNTAPLLVYDFNPHTINRVRRQLKQCPEFNFDTTKSTMIGVLEAEEPAKEKFLKGKVPNNLPAACFMTRGRFNYGAGVLVDESRIIILKPGFGREIKEVEVMYFG
ncbi:hypothetical protein C8J56DRAFT_174412 [Mycena floridula]|nr:hypothetical protein C8J56DRAFT_174412 [Mycena floridula]